jgi:hypothetical protein
MGTGNPKVYSFDNDKFIPKTFFVDFRSSDTEQFIKDNSEDTGILISNEEAECMQDELAWESFDEFLSEIPSLTFFGTDGERHEELSAKFRGDGIIYAKSENGILVVTSDSEANHIAFGFIPNERYDEILDVVYDVQSQKQNWYNQRGLDFDNQCEKLSEIKYKKTLKTFNKEAKLVATQITTVFSDKGFKDFFRIRNGAWLSSKISKKDFIENF